MITDSQLQHISILALDVDGVLTDGTILVGGGGTDYKCFNSLDGHGIRLWRRAGMEVALVTGRASEPVSWRAKELGIQHVFQDCYDKLPVIKNLLETLGLTPAQLAYVGDDVPDLPVLKYAGFAVAVANAVDEVKQSADYVTNRPGGKGAVREVIEYILRRTGRWDGLMERYRQ